MPVIPATQEAEAELPEPRRWRLRWAEVAPLHSSLDDRVRLHLQKTKQNKTKFNPRAEGKVLGKAGKTRMASLARSVADCLWGLYLILQDFEGSQEGGDLAEMAS